MQSNNIVVLHRVKAVMFALLYLYLDKPLYIKKVGSCAHPFNIYINLLLSFSCCTYCVTSGSHSGVI